MSDCVGWFFIIGKFEGQYNYGCHQQPSAIVFSVHRHFLFYVLNILIFFGTITILFAIILKTLPDGIIVWQDALIGLSFTSFFFILGKFAIGFYLSSSAIATAYGAAGFVIIILIWVYYSSIILCFGAEFTKVYVMLTEIKL